MAGGKRKNAGRKPGGKNKTLRPKLINFLKDKDLEEIVKQGLKLCKGVKARRYNKKGEEEVYDIPPNPYMIADFQKHIFGTPSPAILINRDDEEKNAIKITILDYTDKEI